MRVLWALGNYPQLSETYVSAEIAWMKGHGVEAAVWTEVRRKDGAPEEAPVLSSSLASAIAAFRPDLVHAHYLTFAPRVEGACRAAGLPLTVRGHSFDFTPEAARRMASFPSVSAVYLFPRFAGMAGEHPKFRALPVAFRSARYPYAPDKDRDLVLRLAAGRKMKGLSDFVSIARTSARGRFVLGVAAIWDDPGFAKALRASAGPDDGRLSLREDVLWPEAARLMAQAGVYLETSDPKGHSFGMPISVAEAMATGAVLVMPDVPGAREYAGEAALYYRSVPEAAGLLDEIMGLPPPWWKAASEAARERSGLFSDDRVLPGLLASWEAIAGSAP